MAQDGRLRPTIYLPHAQPAVYLASSTWPAYPEAFFSTEMCSDFHISQPTLISPTNSSDSLASLMTSPPSSMSDDVVMITDDACFTETRFSPLSQAPESSPTFPVTAFCYPPNGTLNPGAWYPVLPQTYSPKTSPAPTTKGSPRSRSRSQTRPVISKQKILHYKSVFCS